ncbi:hypothetical protein WJX81_005555 [Elliptochloris bilobata]|uniref:Protein kinase domain-containing protein n=1 Tax=Elliptochloris bilobata TaxID=381761 RepID=A0AAW1RY48_9CHLO
MAVEALPTSSTSSDEAEAPSKSEELAELMGTPPTRAQSRSRIPLPGRRLPREPSAKRERQRRHRHMSKHERQKERLDARAFKELDTTLQVLGIDGAMQPAPAGRQATGAPSPRRPAQSPRALGRSASEAGFSDASADSRSSAGRPGRTAALPPSGAIPPRRRSSPLSVIGGQRRSSSEGALSAEALHRLESARQEWHADLDSVLSGDFACNDHELAISLARSKAADLREQLVWWQAPPEPTWPAREQRLDWLEHALSEAYDISRGLAQHGALEGHASLSAYLSIVADVVAGLRGTAAVCCEAVAEGLRSLAAGPDAQRGMRAAQRAVDIVGSLSQRVLEKTRLALVLEKAELNADLGAEAAALGRAAASVVSAALDAAARMQAALLIPQALGMHHGGASGHEVQVRVRLMQSVWASCGGLVLSAAAIWEGPRPNMLTAWCRLYVKAAQAAERMQSALRSGSTGSSLDSLASLGIDTPPAGVWGDVGSGARRPRQTATDEDLQAQAWLPSCLTALLAEADRAAEAALAWEADEGVLSTSTSAVVSRSGSGCDGEAFHEPAHPRGSSSGDLPKPSAAAEAVNGVVEELGDALYELAHANAVRVLHLSGTPGDLACWALELLEEQACATVVFVRDLDRGVMGRGAHALEHYETLRACTDALVNAILRMRRLLKQKRASDACALDSPRPVVARNFSASSLANSSLASEAGSGEPAALRPAPAEASPSGARGTAVSALPPLMPPLASPFDNPKMQDGAPSGLHERAASHAAASSSRSDRSGPNPSPSPSHGPQPDARAAPRSRDGSPTRRGARSNAEGGATVDLRGGRRRSRPRRRRSRGARESREPSEGGGSDSSAAPAGGATGERNGSRWPEGDAGHPVRPRGGAAAADNGDRRRNGRGGRGGSRGDRGGPRPDRERHVFDRMMSGRPDSEPRAGARRPGAPAGRGVMPWDGDPFWQIRWEDLAPTLVRKLGSGSYGQVYECYFHCAPMAVKIITLDDDAQGVDPQTLLRFKAEVDLQRRLSLHPNIVRFLGACCHLAAGPAPPPHALPGPSQGVTLAIVMELCRFGNLFKVIEYARRVQRLPPDACPGWKLWGSWATRLELARQAAAGVSFMHSQDIIHRDLTSYNLLVTDKWEAKLADFNLSRALREGEAAAQLSQLINSPEWSAPERLAGQVYGKAADVYSFGVILYELVTLAVPWHEEAASPGAAQGAAYRDPIFYVMNSVPNGLRLSFPTPDAIQPPLPELPQVVALAQECWAQCPAARPTMEACCARLEATLAAARARTRTEKGAARAPAPRRNGGGAAELLSARMVGLLALGCRGR